MNVNELSNMNQTVTTNTGLVSENSNSSDALRNDFLTMMVAQIQNQDPLNPMDGTEYVSQLAQFSQVESMDNMALMMQNQSILLDNLQVFSTAALVDQNVNIRTNKFNSDVESISGELTLKASSSQVNLVITDELGGSKTIALGHNAAGKVEFDINVEELGLQGKEFTITTELSTGQDYDPEIQLVGRISNVELPSGGGSSIVSIVGIGDVPVYEIAKFGSKSSEKVDL